MTTTTPIDDLLDRWTGAERATDRSSLDPLLATDFVGVGPVGFVLDRDGWLGRFEYGLRYDRLELDEVAVHTNGDTTVVVAHQHADGRAGDVPTPPDTRVSFTIVPGDEGGPRIASIQNSFIGPPLGGPR
jgi:hypothetical protein